MTGGKLAWGYIGDPSSERIKFVAMLTAQSSQRTSHATSRSKQGLFNACKRYALGCVPARQAGAERQRPQRCDPYEKTSGLEEGVMQRCPASSTAGARASISISNAPSTKGLPRSPRSAGWPQKSAWPHLARTQRKPFPMPFPELGVPSLVDMEASEYAESTLEST